MQFGLFPRLALSISILLCTALLTLGFLLLKDAEQQFRLERYKLASAQARTLADGSLDALVTRDYELLERWVASVLPADYYAYAYLARGDGQVLTDTRLTHIGHQAESFGTLTAPLARERIVDGRRLRELVYPARIGEHHLANAVVAYYLDEQPFYTRSIAIEIVAVLGVFLVLLLSATLLIIRRHIQPLSQLTHTMTTTSLGAAGVRRPEPEMLARSDEVGVLAREYNDLLDRLEASYTELRNEEQRLRDMVDVRTRKLQQTNRELESFAYSVSHDLRAPLRSMNGFCHALQEDYAGQLDATARDYLERAHGASQRMGTLIDALLRLSRVSRKELMWRDINLSEFAQDSLARLRNQHPQRKVETHIETDLVTRGDSALLGVLIDNLIGNAWKYTGKTQHPVIEFGARQQEDETVYCVKDNGAGFDMQYADTLFAPFQRLHRDDEFEGTGIGLATAQRIVHSHHGRIWVEARPDEGASFFFTLGRESDA